MALADLHHNDPVSAQPHLLPTPQRTHRRCPPNQEAHDHSPEHPDALGLPERHPQAYRSVSRIPKSSLGLPSTHLLSASAPL